MRPELGARKVADITYADIDRLHRRLSKTSLRKTGGAPYAANRLVAVLSKIFALAVLWGMRPDNPAKGIERNLEEPRQRYLTGDELRRLAAALAAHPSRQAADAIRLLLLTGARTQEVLKATWDQLDLEAGIWIKPSSHTKQKKRHCIPLSAPARQLLVDMRARQQKTRSPSPYPFPGRSGDRPMVDLKGSWTAIRRDADLQNLRVHDLRHSFASILVSSGLSLPVIGALLGQSNPTTTARYSHLFDDPLRAAAEQVGAVVTSATGQPTADVVRPRPGAEREIIISSGAAWFGRGKPGLPTPARRADPAEQGRTGGVRKDGIEY